MKKIIKVFLSFIIVLLMLFLTISFNLNKVIVDGVIKEIIITKISAKKVNNPNISEEVINTLPLPDYLKNSEDINKLLEDQRVQEIINKYIDITLDNLTSEEIKNIDIESDIINYINENKELIKEITGKEVTPEMIEDTKKVIEESNLNETIEETIVSTKESISTEEKIVLKGYKEIISTKTRIITISLIALCLLLIALIDKSFYKWIKTGSICTIISGILVLLMSFITKLLVVSILPLPSFNVSYLYKSGLIQLIIGSIILIIYIILNKILVKKGE
ncbi:MAG: hypothetical protein IJ399_05065 [Bacilli bacterium]|nr:hypothetical protein [Bacilli bacterium]MBQ8534466.1 hypothetical protein [Bacilli bacterium]